MRISKRIPEIVGLVALVFVGACDTLNIANPNDPDRRRALGDPNSIPSVAQGAFQTWYLTSQGGFGEDQYPALTMSVMARRDRKSTRLNSSHLVISYAVFCLKKKKK